MPRAVTVRFPKVALPKSLARDAEDVSPAAAADEVSPAAADEVSPAAADEVSPAAADEVSPAAADEVSPAAADEVSPAAAVQGGFSRSPAYLRMYLGLVLAAALLAVAVPAVADENSDSARARAAFERGEVLSLTQLLAAVEARYEGRVIETELERHHDRWIYEFRFLPPTGRIFKVVVDAASGEVVGTHGPVQERR